MQLTDNWSEFLPPHPDFWLSRCDFCGADVCDDCKEYLVWSDDLLCPSCLESEMHAQLAFAPRREFR